MQLVARLFSSAVSDAWMIDVSEVTASQLSTPVPVISSDGDDMDSLSEQMMRIYLPQEALGRDVEALVSKVRNCCREVQWDLLLSSRVVSMRPVVVRETEAQEAQTQDSVHQVGGPSGQVSPRQAPPFSFSFFTPRHAAATAPFEQGVAGSSNGHGRGTKGETAVRRRMISKSARWLLSEWQVSSDPSDYVFRHPYPSTDAAGWSDSEDPLSQSENEARSSRSISLQHQSSDRESSLQLASLQAPPTIGSSTASQPAAVPPTYVSRSSLLARTPHHHSQPNLAPYTSQPPPASARAKAKKRRIGGF